jgi:hypothetical protein
MIHTAHWHADKSFNESADGESVYEIYIKAINEARIAIVKECAKKIHGTVYNGAGLEMQDYYKESILKILDQIK